jgi:rod shape-determining protein MreC
MKNFIAFFRRFRVFLVMALFQGVALFLYISNFSFPKNQVLSSASYVNGTMLTYKNEVTKHFNLSHNNKLLQIENKALRERMPLSYMSIDTNTFLINDSLFHLQYRYIPAVVINSTYDKRNNYFTLNKGSLQGVQKGMGVFTEKSIVGIVSLSTEHYSLVKSVLTENINIDVMIESTGAFGILKWDGQHPRHGKIVGISNDMAVRKWSKVITRGGSGIFPRGLAVGKISHVGDVEGKPLWDLSVLYNEDFRKIQNVYVIQNLLREEQEALESKIPEDKESAKK